MLKVKDETIQDIRIAFGALFSVPQRLESIEDEFKQKSINEKLWKDLSRQVAQQILDETGVRWSTPYKIPVLQQLLFRSLQDLTCNT